jgi:hypothetical protein
MSSNPYDHHRIGAHIFSTTRNLPIDSDEILPFIKTLI